MQTLTSIDKFHFIDSQTSQVNISNPADIFCTCSICGDSNGKKKRCHLYIKNGVTNVNCFNGGCPVKNMTLWRYLKEHNPTRLASYRNALKKEWFNEYKHTLKKKKPKMSSVDRINAMTIDFDEKAEPLSNLIPQAILNFVTEFKPNDVFDDKEILVKFVKDLDEKNKAIFKKFIKGELQ